MVCYTISIQEKTNHISLVLVKLPFIKSIMKHLFKSLAAASAVALTSLTAFAPASVAMSNERYDTTCVDRHNNEEVYRYECSLYVTRHQDGYEFRGPVALGERAENPLHGRIWCPYVEGQRVVEGGKQTAIANEAGEYMWYSVKCVFSNYQLGTISVVSPGPNGSTYTEEFGFLHRGARAVYGF